jgi:formate/nitrite transporter FocA (FNT family)
MAKILCNWFVARSMYYIKYLEKLHLKLKFYVYHPAVLIVIKHDLHIVKHN